MTSYSLVKVYGRFGGTYCIHLQDTTLGNIYCLRLQGRFKIFSLLENPKIYYSVHMIPPLRRNLSQMNPTHSLASYFHATNFNIIISSKPKCFKTILVSYFSP